MNLSLAFVFLVSQAAAPSVEGIPAPDVVAAHVGDCVAATSASGVDRAVLTGKGWSLGEARAGRGGPPIMTLFGKAGDMTIMSAMLTGPNAGDCTVMSPVSDAAGIAAIRAALDTALAVQGVSGSGGETVWAAPRHRITLTTIGNAQVQGVRTVVRSLEKK